MPTEGVKTLRFASRITAIPLSTIVGLVTAGGVVRAEYISGSEDKLNGNWVYNFLILEEDIPSGLTFDAITESIFIAPYTQVWTTGESCDEYCYPITATETITELPDYVTGLDVGAEVDGVTQVCEVKITMAEFATLITPELDLDFLATYICEICECGSAAISVEDDAVEILASASTLNFTGAGVTVTDAGAGQADIAIPGSSAIVAYGGIKGTDESTVTNIAAATWEPLIECWDSNMPFENMTPDQANGLITIDETGDYLINASVTFSGTAGNTYDFDIYVNGVTANLRATSTVGDLERQCVGITGILSLIPTENVQIYVTSDGGIDTITARQAQLNAHYLGETTGG